MKVWTEPDAPERASLARASDLSQHLLLFSFFPRVWLSGVFIIGRIQTDGFRELVRHAPAGDPEAIDHLFREVSPYVADVVRAVGVPVGEVLGGDW
jgi:hypothetical protein